jgi:ferric-dicitrate binding protein FerR (iron transport regulator)
MTPDGELPEPKNESWNVDAMWSRVRARTLDAASGRVERAPSQRPLRQSPQRVTAYAAAAMLVLIVGAGALLMRSRNRFASVANDSSPGLYRTSRGQYATIRLSDGSEVTLAPESHLTISARFAQGAREIALDGEAIFSVHHDPAHPFRVRARGALIEDIGTRFDLRAYPADAAVTVAVVEGAVSLGRDRSKSSTAPLGGTAEIVLHVGEVGTLDQQGNATAERSSRASSYLGWASGRLSFVDRPLPEVLRTIGRWYDLDVRVPDARLARRMVTAEFSRQSASEMIDALAVAMDATVEREGRVITLRPR